MIGATWLPEAIKAEGVKVLELDGWRDRGHGDLNQIWGVMCRHTGGPNTSPAETAEGYAKLPGPLAHVHVGKDGSATVVAAGAGWHPSIGDYERLPAGYEEWNTIGIQAVNTGQEDWPLQQIDSFVRCCAAVCRKLGLPADRVIGRNEATDTQPEESDPGGIDMDAFRAKVAERLSLGNESGASHSPAGN